MSYTPINWQTGDTITADKMNKMDNGWGVSSTQLFSETVTTDVSEFGNEGELSYSSVISAAEIIVTFGGTDYTCPVVIMNTGYGYGGVDADWSYDFTDFPFALVFSSEDGNFLATETAGTYTISVNAPAIEVSDDFSDAVSKCVDTEAIPLLCVSGVTTESEMTNNSSRLMYFYAIHKFFLVTYAVANAIEFIPASADISVAFVGGVFTVTEN